MSSNKLRLREWGELFQEYRITGTVIGFVLLCTIFELQFATKDCTRVFGPGKKSDRDANKRAQIGALAYCFLLKGIIWRSVSFSFIYSRERERVRERVYSE